MKKIIIVLCLVGFTGCAQENIMELEGRVAMKGSFPHSYLSIKDNRSQKSYKIQNQKKFNLSEKQSQTIKVEAILIKKKIGPGFPAVIEVVKVK